MNEFFEKNGFLFVKNLLSTNDLKPLIEKIDNSVDKIFKKLFIEKKISNLFLNENFETRFFKLSQIINLSNSLLRWDADLISPELYNLIHNEKITDISKNIIGKEIIHNGDFHLRPKLPYNEKTIFPWHQDSQFYGEKTKYLNIVTVHIPLVDTNIKNGCLRIIKGSNKWGYIRRKKNSNSLIKSDTDIDFDNHADFQILEMKKGDVLFFHNLLFHSSKMNYSSKIRWTLDLRYSSKVINEKVPHIKEAHNWFLEKMNAGWGPMNIEGFNKRTSYKEWLIKRNNENLPGKAGKIL